MITSRPLWGCHPTAVCFVTLRSRSLGYCCSNAATCLQHMFCTVTYLGNSMPLLQPAVHKHSCVWRRKAHALGTSGIGVFYRHPVGVIFTATVVLLLFFSYLAPRQQAGQKAGSQGSCVLGCCCCCCCQTFTPFSSLASGRDKLSLEASKLHCRLQLQALLQHQCVVSRPWLSWFCLRFIIDVGHLAPCLPLHCCCPFYCIHGVTVFKHVAPKLRLTVLGIALL